MKRIILISLLIIILMLVGLAIYTLPINLNKKLSLENYSVNTKYGNISFNKTSDVDVENWGASSYGLSLILVEHGKGSDISQGGCGAGYQFIEITEEYSDRYRGSWKFLGKETFGKNTYDVFDFTLNDDTSIRYYVFLDVLAGGKKSIQIAYRPNSCVKKNYKEVLTIVLETFKYKNI